MSSDESVPIKGWNTSASTVCHCARVVGVARVSKDGKVLVLVLVVGRRKRRFCCPRGSYSFKQCGAHPLSLAFVVGL